MPVNIVVPFPSPVAMTQTVVTVPADTSQQLVASNASRRYLSFVVINVNPANLGFAGSAAADTGFPLEAATAAGRQGGGLVFDGAAVPSNAVHAYSKLGTTIVVLEG